MTENKGFKLTYSGELTGKYISRTTNLNCKTTKS